MFNKFFGNKQPSTKSIFLAGWEVILNGDEQCENFITTHATNKKTVESIFMGIELVFKDNMLYEICNYREGKKSKRLLTSEETSFIYKEYEQNFILQLVESGKGHHQLGGEFPVNFIVPENNCVVPFQYLGFISNHDQNFKWLPFQLHLTCPIYLNIEKMFLDYSNPLSPIILNKEEVEGADTSYDDLKQNSEIVFEELNFTSLKADHFYDGNDNPSHEEIMKKVLAEIKDNQIGIGGIPNWIQNPDIPICPKTQKRMKFVCQIKGGVKAKRSNVEPENEFYRQYFEEMNFWGDGDLFVFFEPASKVGCYFIQNT